MKGRPVKILARCRLCSQPVRALGLCVTHYNQHLKERHALEGRTCAIDGCMSAVWANGLCKKHNEKVRRSFT